MAKSIPTVYLTRGLPGSGKSTWAKQCQANVPDEYVLVAKDDLREMLHQGVHTQAREKFVCSIRDAIITQAIAAGKNVIVHDTNFAPKHEVHIRQIVGSRAEVVIQDFTHVPIEECIARDLKRPRSVGEAVIRKMHRDYLAPKTPAAYTHQDPTLPPCIIVDVDGTLARMSGRRPYDWGRVGEDEPHGPVLDVVKSYIAHNSGVAVIIMSGRDGVCSAQTDVWLQTHLGRHNYDQLLMRAPGDNRPDTVVKRELFDEHVAGKYRVNAVFDDRDSVVAMWRRELGLPCFQVAEGAF